MSDSSNGRTPQVEPVSPELSEVGNLDSVCPYCAAALEKKPSRKKKCPDCNNFIYVRTRPFDRKRVLVTEAQRDLIDVEWSRLLHQP